MGRAPAVAVTAQVMPSPDGEYVVVDLGDQVEVTLHPSLHIFGAVNIEVDGDLIDGRSLRVHVNDQLLLDSDGWGRDGLSHLGELAGYALAEAAALSLADGVREAVLAEGGRRGAEVTLTALLDAAVEYLYTAGDTLPAGRR
jgi:hypothetical protein